MNLLLEKLSLVMGWVVNERTIDYREGKALIYDAIVKINTQINQTILTVSVATLAALAALNKEIFVPYPLLSFVTIAVFVLVILLSVVNLYLSNLVLADMQKKFTQNWSSLRSPSKGVEDRRYQGARRVLNGLVLGGFCFGLIIFLAVIGLFIMGAQ